jgi:DNA-binding MarR family transcriptional regulator
MQKTHKGESPCYCIKVRRAARIVTAYYDKFLTPSGLTVNQYSLLVNLEKLGESNVSELANHVGLERTTLVRNIKPLLERGYVQDSSRAEARDCRLSVTALGREVLTVAMPLWEKAQKGIDDKIGADKIKLLNELFGGLETL